MPRLRRQARQRRTRPELARGVWEWLQGRAYDDLPEGNKWDLFLLEMNQDDPERFWDRAYAAVEAGELAISDTKEHCFGDESLFPSRMNVSHLSNAPEVARERAGPRSK